jgi:hypothetical protein
VRIYWERGNSRLSGGFLCVPKYNVQAVSGAVSLEFYRAWVNTIPSGNKPAAHYEGSECPDH